MWILDTIFMKNEFIRQFKEAQQVLEAFTAQPENLNQMELAGSLMTKALQQGGKIISCGNGGSMSDAMHFAEELTGRFRDNRAPIPAMAVSDPGHISCVSNDFGYEYIFSRYVQAHGRQGDILLAISTSGNSPNILRATEAAKEKGMRTVALTGKDGGAIAGLADAEIRVPHHGYADRIQEVHIKIIHNLILYIEKKLNP